MRILFLLFILISFSSFGQATFHSLLTDRNASVIISTDVDEPVDGAFEIDITFQVAVTGLTEADFTLTGCSMENLFTLDDINYTANILPDGTGDAVIFLPANKVTPVNALSNTLTVTVDEDFVFLTNPATSNVYYEFRELVGDNNTAIVAGDPGLRDLSGNARHLSLIGSPEITQLQGAADVALDKMALRIGPSPQVASALSFGSTGSTFLDEDFSIQWECRANDGQVANIWFACGNFDGTNSGLRIDFGTTGLLRIRYQGFTWISTAAAAPNGATGLMHFDIHFDFTTDVLTVNKNGSAVAGSFTVSSMAATNPASYNCTANLYVGTQNNNGTTTQPTNATQLTYFAITKLQGTSRMASVRSYLQNRKATFEVVDELTDATYIDHPHDIIVSRFHERAYVSGKGDDGAIDQDGTFAIIDISDPTNLSVLGGYNGTDDQLDGETVLELSTDRVLHFFDGGVHLFNVSNPAAPTIVKTVSYIGLSINGAVVVGDRYVIGANKGGYLQTFDFGAGLSDIDNFTLVGSYDTTTDLDGDGPHDIDICADGEHVILCSRGDDIAADYDFAIYKVMNAGSLITMGSWTYASRLHNTSIYKANRSRVMVGLFGGMEVAVLSCDPNFAVIDITTKSAPSILDTFDMTTFASGLHQFRQRWTIPTWQVGLRLLNVTDPTNIIQDAGYYNSTRFTVGNASFHDIDTFEKNGFTYLFVAAQSSSQVVAFKINRFTTL